MAAQIIDLTEYKIKKSYVEVVNEYISLFNAYSKSSSQSRVFQDSIYCHMTTARAMGWHDVGELIEIQWFRMLADEDPQEVVLKV